MALFKKIKQGFKELTSKDSSKGQTLGGRTANQEDGTYEVAFSGDKLGFTLNRGPRDQPLVGNIDKNGTAFRSGVLSDDIVVGVEGNPVHTFDDVMAIIGALPRPIHLTFARGQPGARAARPSSSSRRAQQGSYVPPAPPVVLSEEERQARREAQLKATEARTSKWDKKLADNKKEKLLKKKAEGDRLAPTDPNDYSEETKKLIDIAKAREAEEVARMGYNPYQVQMSSNQQARAAIVGTGPDPNAGTPVISNPGGGGTPSPSMAPLPAAQMPPPGQVAAPEAPTQYVDDPEIENQNRMLALNRAAESEIFGAQIEDSLAILLSQDNDVSAKAIKTIQKMIGNISKNQHEEKFRKVRMGNPNFDEKVGSITGGIEVMQAIGFELHTNEEEAFLIYPEDEAVDGTKLSIGTQKLEAALNMIESS
mmetsp:Transcript_1499/g.2045  ORF Transcript_1499/g.2045 Transcript_1499/m.2045 type:complete len:423 (-) Transcript_1499:240-1508(-)|eukprot:CAMPEP_0117754980 /NCGR_PEP_ID=MMETSP0947-20121206/13172_1 /TAXON_ID=44440 /ORGANISM="Chattonella subsalsa, Strain CCMP2191" /LENGTH=422 /DNA_ID=CAMNT_0005574213 /DNA_START=73 /DNA_END=1341 /DNA_ORIENTATION=-